MNRLQALARRPPVRIGVGLLTSAAFVIATLTRVEVPEVVAAVGRVSAFGLALTLVFVWLEVLIRAWRWQVLLTPVVVAPYRTSLAYLCIGYFANTFLPVRLGDVVRAYLAGPALGSPRLAVLGTVVVERFIDGVFTVSVVLALGIAMGDGGSIVNSAESILALSTVGAVGLIALLLLVRVPALATSPPVATASRTLDRILPGAVALRRPSGIALVAAATVAGYASAVAAFAMIAAAVGLHLAFAQAGLAMAGVALATALPAAPGSIGTYEFVGLALLTGMGFPAEQSLAAVVLLHVSGLVLPSTIGAAAAWILHFDFRAVTGSPKRHRRAAGT